jgi:hypothetical protein
VCPGGITGKPGLPDRERTAGDDHEPGTEKLAHAGSPSTAVRGRAVPDSGAHASKGYECTVPVAGDPRRLKIVGLPKRDSPGGVAQLAEAGRLNRLQ